MTMPAEGAEDQAAVESTAQPVPNTIDQVSPEQWQSFIGGLTEQNNMLQAQLSQTTGRLAEVTRREQQEALDSMTDKERADALQKRWDDLQAAANNAQAQEVSTTVWQRRDADAAARILQSHGLSGNEPELYRAAWDVNWMPRFAASVDQVVRNRESIKRAAANAPAENPANRANVGNGTGSAVPELAETASGFDTIRFALSRQK